MGHVSDCLMCGRLKVFENLDESPTPISDKKLGYFTSGKSIHSILQSLFRANRGRFECEKYVEYMGIEGHVDIWDKRKNIPIEFKTYRGSNLLNEPIGYNLTQLKFYMAMLDSPTGYLIYQYLNKVDSTVFKQFKIEMDQWERKEWLGKLVEKMTSIKNAIKVKDPSLVDGVWHNELSWLCYDCPYLAPCKEMRPKNGTTT